MPGRRARKQRKVAASPTPGEAAQVAKHAEEQTNEDTDVQKKVSEHEGICDSPVKEITVPTREGVEDTSKGTYNFCVKIKYKHDE